MGTELYEQGARRLRRIEACPCRQLRSTVYLRSKFRTRIPAATGTGPYQKTPNISAHITLKTIQRQRDLARKRLRPCIQSTELHENRGWRGRNILAACQASKTTADANDVGIGISQLRRFDDHSGLKSNYDVLRKNPHNPCDQDAAQSIVFWR